MVQFSTEALRTATTELVRTLGPVELFGTPTFENLVRYVETLNRFGARTDLVGARSAEGLVEIALGDSLVLARHPELVQSPVWEIGAGGASLTIPLALMFSDLMGKLVEPRQKRATFLRMAIGSLGLTTRFTVEQKRVEPDEAPAGVAKLALARAVFPPEVWIPMAARLVGPGGVLVVLTTDVIAVPQGYSLRAMERYELPFARAKRVATWLSPE